MVALDKFDLLTRSAQFDICGYSGRRELRDPARYIYRAAVPGKGTTCLFKILQTNVCVNDCIYCVNQACRDVPRGIFAAEELARTFMSLHDKRLVRGLFLSSAMGVNPDRTMGAMLDTVNILRQKYEFKGYVHLKILPGASFSCVGSRLQGRRPRFHQHGSPHGAAPGAAEPA